MVCPKCGSNMKVIDTAFNPDENKRYRKHGCAFCHSTIFTMETQVYECKSFMEKWHKYYRTTGDKQTKRIPEIIHPGRPGRRVRCLDTGEIFESLAHAARANDLSASGIQRCCTGERYTHGGLRWKYYDENEKEKKV